MSTLSKAKQKYKKYKNWIRYNRDLLAGDLIAFPAAAGISELVSHFTDSAASITAGAFGGDYIGYDIGYAGSSFLFNRNIYWDSDRKCIRKEYWKDIGKFLISEVGSIIPYYIVRSGLNYACLKHGIEPYQASIASQAVSIAVWYASMNFLGHKFGIVHKKKSTDA